MSNGALWWAFIQETTTEVYMGNATCVRKPVVGECPGLLPVEIGTIIHWACVDLNHAYTLVRDIEINRNVAMCYQRRELVSDPPV